MKEENGCPLVGYLDIGGVALPRGVLMRMSSDPRRFDAYVDEALAVDEYMSGHAGAPPPVARTWTGAHREAIRDTLRELAAIQELEAHKLEAVGLRELAKERAAND